MAGLDKLVDEIFIAIQNIPLLEDASQEDIIKASAPSYWINDAIKRSIKY